MAPTRGPRRCRAAEPLASLRPAAGATEPSLGDSASAAEAAARSFLEARGAEAAAWRRFSFLTFGGRIELAAQAMTQSIEAALDEKDRWRVYLAAYAAALLIGIGYLGCA